MRAGKDAIVPTNISRKLTFRLLPAVLIGGVCVVVLSRGIPAPLSGSKQETPDGPSQVVQTYWELSMQGKIEEARRYETNTDGRFVLMKTTDINLPKSIYESNRELRRVLSEVVKGDRAQVVSEVKNSNGTICVFLHGMYRDNGAWKIYTMYTIDPSMCKYLPEMCNLVDQ